MQSWLPNWMEGHSVCAQACNDVTGTRAVCFDHSPPFSACKKSSASLVTSCLPGKLLVRVKRLGAIQSRIAAAPMGAHPVRDYSHFEGFIKTCQKWCGMFASVTSYPTGEEPLHAAMRMLSWPRNLRGPDVNREDILHWINTMLEFDRREASDQSGVSRTDQTKVVDSGDVVTFITSGNYYPLGKDADDGNLNAAGRMQKVQHWINYKANYAALLFDSGYFGLA